MPMPELHTAPALSHLCGIFFYNIKIRLVTPKINLVKNSDLQAGIWFGSVALSPIFTLPISLWLSCLCL